MLFGTKYADPRQIKPGILKLTFRRGQSKLNIIFIFVSCEEKVYYRVVSVGHLTFVCRSYCGRSRRMQGFCDQIQAVLSYGATSLSHYMIFLDQIWLACSFPAFFLAISLHTPLPIYDVTFCTPPPYHRKKRPPSLIFTMTQLSHHGDHRDHQLVLW